MFRTLHGAYTGVLFFSAPFFHIFFFLFITSTSDKQEKEELRMVNLCMYHLSFWLPDNCALSGYGQGSSCRGQGRSCRGQGRSCRQYWYAFLKTSYLRPWTTLEIQSMLGSFLFRSLEAPPKTSDTIFWVAVMRWSAAFLFRELKKVDFSSMRLSGAWLCGLDSKPQGSKLESLLRALLVSR